jgi:uncharacterized protein (DUF2267 family)
MDYQEFMGQVQHRAQLPSFEDAVTATRVTLEVLSERMAGGAPENLAAQLPREVGIFLKGPGAGSGYRFSLAEFDQLVAEREGKNLPTASFHARAVMSVVRDAVSPGEFANARAQLPADYGPLFDAEDFRRMTA